MILTGPEIMRQRALGAIIIDPFDLACINPNSYDFHLGGTLAVYAHFPLDPQQDNPTTSFSIPPEGFVLQPQHVYLGATIETLGSTTFAPSYATRSSVARLGIFINLSATLGDIGYIGRWPLHLVAVQPVRVYAGMAIGQMLWWVAAGPTPDPSPHLRGEGNVTTPGSSPYGDGVGNGQQRLQGRRP